jgi:zinc/manganese transport system substrate-binding protein
MSAPLNSSLIDILSPLPVGNSLLDPLAVSLTASRAQGGGGAPVRGCVRGAGGEPLPPSAFPALRMDDGKEAARMAQVEATAQAVRAAIAEAGITEVHYVQVKCPLLTSERIADALAQRWPAEQAQTEKRRQQYLQRITALDQQVRQQLNRVPRAQRRVVTSHDAFGYFSAAYGVRFIAPRGWTTGSEPSAETVARIVRQARETQASALLVENISDPRMIERIAREAQVKVGGELYSDALSPPGTAADTYLRMFEHNVRTLLDAMTPAKISDTR